MCAAPRARDLVTVFSCEVYPLTLGVSPVTLSCVIGLGGGLVSTAVLDVATPIDSGSTLVWRDVDAERSRPSSATLVTLSFVRPVSSTGVTWNFLVIFNFLSPVVAGCVTTGADVVAVATATVLCTVTGVATPEEVADAVVAGVAFGTVGVGSVWCCEEALWG